MTETPILDRLTGGAPNPGILNWIKEVLGEDPIEFSTLNPDQHEIMDEIIKIKKYNSQYEVDRDNYYMVLKAEDDPSLKMVAHYIEKDQKFYVVVWLRPSDLHKVLDAYSILNLLLKQF